MSKNAKFYADDTGKVDEGTYEEVECIISSDAISKWKTIVAPICRGDEYETAEGQVKQVSIPAQFKFIKGTTILQRMKTAHDDGTQQGVMCCTGDSAVAGHEALEMNALVETWTVKKQTGSHIIVDATFLPHTENTDADLPQLLTTVAAP